MRSDLLSMYKTFVGASAVSKETPTKEIPALLKPRVSARMTNDVTGVCPFCQSAMSKSSTAGAQVYVCHHDRYVAPVPNQELGVN